MPIHNPTRAAAKRLDRFIASYGDELVTLPKATQNHLIDLVWNGQSARARIELQEAVAAQRSARSARAKAAHKGRLAEHIIRAYRTASTNRPVDEPRLRRNIAVSQDPKLGSIVNRFKGDPHRLGQELRYRAGEVSGSDYITGAFYHGRTAIV
jgi:hypothetical protein